MDVCAFIKIKDTYFIPTCLVSQWQFSVRNRNTEIQFQVKPNLYCIKFVQTCNTGTMPKFRKLFFLNLAKITPQLWQSLRSKDHHMWRWTSTKPIGPPHVEVDFNKANRTIKKLRRIQPTSVIENIATFRC